MSRHRCLAIAAAALALGLLPGAPRAFGAAGAQAIRYVEGTDPTPMDPAFVTDTPTWSLLHLLYDNLVTFRRI